jgi:signal transduction histidine kinase
MSTLSSWLFAAPGFMPHGHCYLWQPATLWLNVGSDGLIAAAYFAIPFSLYDFVRRRTPEVPFPGLFLMFAAFIFLCGATHIMEILTVWSPQYRLGGALKLLTGIVSIATTVALFRLMPRALQLRSARELQHEVQTRTLELAEANAKLLRTVEELERQREELQTMLDLMPVGVAIAHDPLAQQMSASSRLADLLHIAPSQNLSLSADNGPRGVFRCTRNGVEIPADELPMQQAARTGREQRDVEVDVEFPDGRAISLMVSAAPLFHRDGTVRGAIGAHVDVTALKAVQHALMDADRQKNEFLAMLAHELRNPLAPIGHATDLLVRIPSTDARVRAAASMIQRQVTQLTRLVGDLLDVSRITRGQIELKLQVIELATVVRLAVEAVEPLMNEGRHAVSVDIPPGPLCVLGDSTRLVQCIVNILNNAAKYSDAGTPIRVALCSDGADALVSVQDEGMGIAAEFLPRIFELFSQSERSLDRAKGGLGVGLSLVQKIIALHNGAVICRSDGVGHGCTFEIRLPIEARGAKEPAVDPQPPAAVARRILIVDDNRDAADALAMLLTLDGHEIHVVYGGEAALAVVGEFRPQVVLLDIGLPNLDGYEVARAMRALPGLDAIRIVALTGYGHGDDRRRALEAGFDGHLVKPVDHTALVVAIGASSPYG